MNKVLIILFFCACATISIHGQVVGIKTNVLYDATTTFNLGIETGLGKKMTLDISANYNPWEFKDHKQFKHWFVQPELRWWFCERFNGSFLGIHGMYGEYNVSNLDLPFGLYPGLKNARYQGSFYGAGLTYGYQWILGKHWNLEAAIGAGYARVKYDKYLCGECGKLQESGHKNYFGPTKLAISFIYLF